MAGWPCRDLRWYAWSDRVSSDTIGGMSTQDVSPFNAVPGEVVSPSAVTQSAASAPAHEFFGVIKKLIHSAGFHTQADVDNAVNAVNAYEQHVVPASDMRAIDTEGDTAPVEDVSKRRPPVPPTVSQASQGQSINYDQLAQAIVRAQQAQTTSQENS